ncbi:uncharacterized protein LOC117301497 [Asterias rubens]|uniref:uncharacterized protein LOC117301497 n=1 Tax=Asterias rubens TaxID=7604 RepID=UPI001454E708|nr:uncharacterized protein LOC117301497 [Asterias rubens]
MTKFVLLVALALACSEAGALKCFLCNSVFSPNPDCEKSPPDSKYVATCPAPPANQVAHCTKLDGVITTILDMDDFERTCANFATNELPGNKCYTDQDAENWILKTVDPSVRPLLNGSFSFKGSVCFCDTDECNSVASVQPFLGLLVVALGLCVMGVWR